MRIVDKEVEDEGVIYNEIKALQGNERYELTLAAVTISDLKCPSFLQNKSIDNCSNS